MEEEYEVEAVVDIKYVQGTLHFAVLWTSGEATWEPIQNMYNAAKKVEKLVQLCMDLGKENLANIITNEWRFKFGK